MLRLLLVVLFAASIHANPDVREYHCAHRQPHSPSTECRLRFDGDSQEELSAVNDNGCFMHFDSTRNATLELCPLQCYRSTDASVLKASECVIGESVGVERRNFDWFMWRRSDCRQRSSVFNIECRMAIQLNAIEDDDEQEEIISNESDDTNIEDIGMSTSPPSTTTTTAIVAENEDELPERIDTVLGFMFPNYRKARRL